MEPSPVDSEGIISFRTNQSTESTVRPADDEKGTRENQSTDVYDVSVEYDTADDLSDMASVTSNNSQNEVQTTGDTNKYSTVHQMSEVMSGVTSVLKDVVKELRDLKQSTLHQNPDNHGSLGSKPAGRDTRDKAVTWPPEFVPRHQYISNENNTYNEQNHDSCSYTGYRSENITNNRLPSHTFGAYYPRVQGPASTYNDCYNYHYDNGNINSNQSYVCNQNVSVPRYGRGDFCVSSLQRTRAVPENVPIKISPFTGSEDWSVWATRFETIAGRKGWTKDEMLDQLLPRI